MKKITCLALIMGSLLSVAYAQNNLTESGNTPQQTPRDNFYNRYLHKEKKVIDHDFIHEKDVFWEKRIWRLIDIREKRNHIFMNPIQPFVMVLINSAINGDVTLYHALDDAFSNAMTDEERNSILYKKDTICTFDPEDFSEICVPVINEFNPEDVQQFRLKEVYYFDEETSTMDVRILGVAPIIERYDENGNFLNSGPLFWAYYPELRKVLSKVEVKNDFNDAAHFTWEDIFEARLFSSYIIKSSNILDKRLKDSYSSPMAILLEAEQIQNTLFYFEHDLWTY